MTNSMIPYSFIPGTKAKASEVNANFIALTELINVNKDATDTDFQKVNENLATKADKTELVNEFTITEAETDLNNYKTKGTYIFTTLYTPTNIPKGEAGTLIVTGDINSTIKQIWFSDGDNPEIFTRDYKNSTWSKWFSSLGQIEETDTENTVGYLKLPNGIIIQWGYATEKTLTYPIAYSTWATPFLIKTGYSGSYERSDSGLTETTLTGLIFSTAGKYTGMYWIVIGR